MASKVMILCSGFGLGFYIPGLLLKNALSKENIEAQVDVFEHYMSDEKESGIEKSRRQYHKDFSTVQLAARLPIDIRESLDEGKVSALLKKWKDENINYFISLSGHWGHILKRYGEITHITVENLHIDCADAPSWLGLNRYFPDNKRIFDELHMYDLENNKIIFRIPVESEEKNLAYQDRENRFVVHGGGWGMGTYRRAQKELSLQNFKMDVVIYQLEELERCSNTRYFANDPNWKAWNQREGEYIFPPYNEIKMEGDISYQYTEKCHWLYKYIQNSKGIISKPGAGTLIDSMESETPLIMLEPFGKHERANYQLWENLGFGLSYQAWKECGFSIQRLERCHDKLAAAKKETISICEHIKKKMESA